MTSLDYKHPKLWTVYTDLHKKICPDDPIPECCQSHFSRSELITGNKTRIQRLGDFVSNVEINIESTHTHAVTKSPMFPNVTVELWVDENLVNSNTYPISI